MCLNPKGDLDLLVPRIELVSELEGLNLILLDTLRRSYGVGDLDVAESSGTYGSGLLALQTMRILGMLPFI